MHSCILILKPLCKSRLSPQRILHSHEVAASICYTKKPRTWKASKESQIYQDARRDQYSSDKSQFKSDQVQPFLKPVITAIHSLFSRSQSVGIAEIQSPS